jgi:hypothetical protein
MSRNAARLSVAALLVAAAAAIVSATAAPARAALGVACPDPNAQVFLPWGDVSFYADVPNGGFESGATGWTLSGGAKVVSGNESFSVGGADDTSSLSLPAGSSATSSRMCIGALSGHMRLFTANGGSSSSRLRVQVIYGGGLGSVLGIFDAGSLASSAAWQPSPWVTMLGGTLPLLTQYVQFRFSPADSVGSWRIDDTYLDPLMHG